MAIAPPAPRLARPWLTGVLAAFVTATVALNTSADDRRSDAPTLASLASGESEMRSAIERFSADAQAIGRSYPVRLSISRYERYKAFYGDWLRSLEGFEFEKFSHEGQIDWLLLHNYLQREMRQLDIRQGYIDEAAPLMPFAQTIVDLAESRRRMERMDGAKAAATLTELDQKIKDVRKALEAGLKNNNSKGDDAATQPATATATAAASSPEAQTQPEPIRVAKKPIANRASRYVRDLRNSLKDWHDFHDGYDPEFSWWIADPYKQVDKTLEDYAKFLREKVVGVSEDDKKTIIGDPIGREALLSDLQFEMIPYTPEELIEIAQREYAWCKAEMIKASTEMGFGEDWKAALEKVKQQHVAPGEQPTMVRELALEAIKFVEDHDLVTVPELCKEIWRMDMMGPQQQLQSPFFLGGEVIQVAFPTSEMSHKDKEMSLRGNNRHFARATVFHELIPGHHLQGFMTDRYRPYRQVFSTPFWLEGWALYWEMLMWDQGFPKSPENRVGMLFWRMHRCARIIFSLSFHLERMTPQECIDSLVENVGHERANAEAEVRRSFEGDYGPLYQIAYMIGGLQIRSLHHELVDSKKMTNREFHDAILHENAIPIEMLRAIMTDQPATKNFTSAWRFYDLE